MSVFWTGVLVGAALMWLAAATLAYPCHVVSTPGLVHLYAGCRDGFAWQLW